MMRVSLMGPPGAGKGTQAEKIIHFLGVPHVSTGDMLRKARADETELGLAAGRYMDQGQLVPDQLVVDVIEECLAGPEYHEGYLLDGFPRSLGQAQAFEQYLLKTQSALDVVVNLDVPEEELLARLSSRNRADDSADVVKNRLSVYREETQPLIDYYEKQQLLEQVDGLGTVDEIFDRIKAVLERYRAT